MTTQTRHWYLACSLSMYQHPTYDQVLRHIEARLPDISPDTVNKVVQAKGLYQRAKDWLEKWPRLCEGTIDGGLFFMLDAEGWIGKGVHTEISDVLKRGLPVYLMAPDGNYYRITDLEGPAFVDGPDWKMYTFVDVRRLEGGSVQ